MAEAMTLHSFCLDIPLSLILLWVGWRLLATQDLHKAVILFIVFGSVMTLVWVRLGAVDVALAEAAIGSGLTGALLWSALSRMRPGEEEPGMVDDETKEEDH